MGVTGSENLNAKMKHDTKQPRNHYIKYTDPISLCNVAYILPGEKS
jgi:hypothetical protein